MSSLQFEGALESGIKYEIHSTATFSGLEELAIVIDRKPVTILTITTKRNGAIEVKPVMSSKVMFGGEKQNDKPRETPVSTRRVSED